SRRSSGRSPTILRRTPTVNIQESPPSFVRSVRAASSRARLLESLTEIQVGLKLLHVFGHHRIGAGRSGDPAELGPLGPGGFLYGLGSWNTWPKNQSHHTASCKTQPPSRGPRSSRGLPHRPRFRPEGEHERLDATKGGDLGEHRFGPSLRDLFGHGKT